MRKGVLMSDGLLFAQELLELLQSQPGAQKRILYVDSTPTSKATFSSQTFSQGDVLQQLYTHQAEVLEKALQKQHIAIATATASGKTLATTLPYIVELRKDPHLCLLCIAPTRSLVEQWCDRLREWCPDRSVKSFTGDTPDDEKTSIRRNAQIIVTTPDMFHTSMLPYHHGWSSFYRRLRYVIIDESHIYRGVFGSHMSHILLRFKRIATYYRSSPTILFASATIGNPKEHAEGLLAQSVTAVTHSGAPTGGCLFVLWQPFNKFFHSDD